MIKKIWNYEFGTKDAFLVKITLPLIIVFGIIYIIAELLLGQNPSTKPFSILNLNEWTSTISNNASSNSWLESNFTTIWLSLVILCALVRFTIIIVSYFKSKKIFGEKEFFKNFLNYTFSFLIAFLSAVLLLVSLQFVVKQLGVENSLNLFELLALKVKAFFTNNIPNLISIKSYWVALILSIFLVGLPLHFIHWLSHKSRLVWYVTHRAHHCPEILHPMGAPPAFVFDFFLLLPSVFVGAIISSLIYTESLVLEMAIWFLLGYFMEIFNHSSVHYNLAYKNPIIRNLCRLFGDKGVYHIVHHSAYQEDQEVNFSAAPFNFWDRVFGTYRKPYEKIPDLGLTNQPELKLNPIRIIFSGILQIIYEFWHNPSIIVKFKVIFGPIHYQPPISKDYLIVKK